MQLDDAIDRLMGRQEARTDASFPPYLSPDAAAQAARLAAPREPVPLSVGEETWFLSLLPAAPVAHDLPFAAALSIGVEAAQIRTVPVLARSLVRSVEPRIDIDRLDADLVAMLLELSLEPEVERLEARLGTSVVFERTGVDPVPGDLAGTLTAPDGTVFPFALGASAALRGRLVASWLLQPALDAAIEPGAILALRFGASRMRLSELQDLAVGDAILPDFLIEYGRAALCVLGEYLAVPVAVDNERRALPTGPMRRDVALSHGEFLMSDSGETVENRLIDDADIEGTPVELVFELGRRHITVGEMRALGVGAPLPLDRPVEAAVDIFAGGRRIGAGEVVQIGDRIGVRITRLGSTQ